MSQLNLTAALFADSAISRAELKYQQRSSGRQRRWLRWIWRAIFTFGVTMSMILFWGEFAGALLQRNAGPIGETLREATVAVVGLAVIYHFVLMFQTLSLAANSIARERQNKTWDMLILTGIDARQIVWGKWRATVQRQWRSYLLLAVLRAGAAVWFTAANSRYILNVVAMYGSYGYYNYNPPTITLPTPLGILFAGLIIVGFTMVNLAFTAACGVLASAQIRRSALALGRAIGLRLLIILSFVVLIVGVPALTSTLTRGQVTLWFSIPWLENILAACLATLFDNGVTLAGEFASIHYVYYDSFIIYSNGEILVSIVITLAIYLLLTRGLLRLAQRRAVREQALPPVEIPQQQKRETALS